MTPDDFIQKWRHVELKERSASQSHFNDLCRLLGLEDPTTADPKGEWFTFEKGATKVTGGEGWADVWRKDCFAWEYKGKRKDLDAAFVQLQRYAIALNNPPLLIVSDMDTIRIHTNWTNTVQQIHTLSLEDLRDGGKRDLLKAAFENPEVLKPQKTRQLLTEQAAEQFAKIALRLRKRGHESHAVAHFVNRLIFCMFAEDANLLPAKIFERMLEFSTGKNADKFADHAQTLFAAMKSGGMVGFERVDWFNGGLFDSDDALPLTWEDIDDLKRAAQLDWSDVDPSIMGTLFERGLDPDKRSQLGAHYTDRDKIMMIVNPVIKEPLEAEWEAIKTEIATLTEGGDKSAPAKAKKLKSDFLERLANFRILDPACGSGNFLYLSLLTLKDIEHRANVEAEAYGLQRESPRTGPENVLGIELNPYAAELARVSVWIGEIQWLRRNGYGTPNNPVLRSLNTIENRDAVLAPDGTRAEWPKADVVVGNPPFLGNKKMIRELGEEYTFALRKAYEDVPGGVDLVAYWFAKAWQQMQAGNVIRAGLVSTNSIRGGANREVLKPIVEGGRIFEAWSDEAWTVDGAAVRVSMVCFANDELTNTRLNGSFVEAILADLTPRKASSDITRAATLVENGSNSFIGVFTNGQFEIDADLARSWLTFPRNVNGLPNAHVLRRTLNGADLLRGRSDKWVVDFGVSLTLEDAAQFEAPFEYILEHVRPFRQRLNEDGSFAVRRVNHRENWWRYAEARPGMRNALSGLDRFIVTPMVSSTRVFCFLESSYLANQKLVVVPRPDFTTLGILSSNFHYVWTLAACTWIGTGNDVTYSPTMTFETFPFPEGLTPNIPAKDYEAEPRAQKIAAAAKRLNELRENWLNPADLVTRVPEVVPGYPDRILPKDDKSAAELKKRTLTNLYNQRPAWLDHAHKALDQAVAEAYGWESADLSDDEILARLFALNQERAALEAVKTPAKPVKKG